jgi:hypothetical protein
MEVRTAAEVSQVAKEYVTDSGAVFIVRGSYQIGQKIRPMRNVFVTLSDFAGG